MSLPLFLCSSSKIRQQLLHEAQIPFIPLNHCACEKSVPYNESLGEYVQAIATAKLASINPEEIPHAPETFLILTADTLVQGNKTKKVFSKPDSIEHAKEIIKEISQEPLQVTTGCSLALIKKGMSSWITQKTISWHTGAQLIFKIPNNEIDNYLKNNPQALYATGATTIEGYGARYIQSINGSYTAVLGLPLFELVENLRIFNAQGL